MKKHILLCGGIAGSLFIPQMVYIAAEMGQNPDFEGNMIVGFAIMFTVFSLLFVGIRDYRNKVAGGQITFLQALKMGALMALLFWQFNFTCY